MQDPARSFIQVNVFSSLPTLGNPVAVVTEGEGLSDEQMQDFARWTNLSETTFISAPTNPRADYRLRIFTPGGELPFAGHPTLGSAHAWLESGGKPQDPSLIVQQCEAGLIEVARGGDGTFSFKAPPRARTGPLDLETLEQFCAALGINSNKVLDHQWVDNGPGWAVIQMSTAAEVLEVTPDFSNLPNAMLGVIGRHPEDEAADFEIRSFAPGIGVAEDPVTGSLNASVAQWLFEKGEVSQSFTVSQGQVVGRKGLVTLSQDQQGEVWVGGVTATVIAGLAFL